MNERTTNDRSPNQRSSADAGKVNEGANEGEGNRSADRRYREATKQFVDSERGREAVRNAGNVTPDEEHEIEQAEQQAKQRAKEHDPAELRNPAKPAS
jgi:hypothetical protein